MSEKPPESREGIIEYYCCGFGFDVGIIFLTDSRNQFF